MPPEPTAKKAAAFVDGQNLFFAAKEAFGYTYPNYDVVALTAAVCRSKGWAPTQTRFYTGIPNPGDDAFWHQFWSGKLLVMSRQGVQVFSRSLRYRNKRAKCPKCGSEYTVLTGEEKGVDVRIGLDAIRMAHRKDYDVALFFSQDQDLSEVAEEIRAVSIEQGRWIKVATAFPVSPTSRNTRGINRTEWIPIDRAVYDACLDPTDYRPKPPAGPGRATP